MSRPNLDKKRVHITIPSDLYEKLSLTASRKGTSFSELISEALRRHLPGVWSELSEQEIIFKDEEFK